MNLLREDTVSISGHSLGVSAGPSAPLRFNQLPLDTIIQIPAVLDEHLGTARTARSRPARQGVYV